MSGRARDQTQGVQLLNGPCVGLGMAGREERGLMGSDFRRQEGQKLSSEEVRLQSGCTVELEPQHGLMK